MSLQDFLAGDEHEARARVSLQCSICQNPELAAEVAQVVEGIKDGTIAHTIGYLHRKYFGPRHGVGAAASLRNHIRLHLGEDL